MKAGRGDPERPRRPIPSWLLAVPVVAALGGAGWLFLAGDDDRREGRQTDTTPREQADDVLSVPEPDEDATSPGRREDRGRERLDEGRGDDGDASTDDEPADEDDTGEDDEVREVLRGRRITFSAASVSAAGDRDRLVGAGGLRIPCASMANAAQLELEQELLERLRERFAASGAVVRTLPDTSGGSCVDVRMRVLERAEFAIVVRAGDVREPRVLAARPAAGVTAAGTADSVALARELATALGIGEAETASSATESLLARVAAVDLRGGAAVAFVDLRRNDLAVEATLDRTATQVVDALAVLAARE